MKKYLKTLLGILSLGVIVIISIMIYKKFENNNNALTDAEKFKEEYKGVDKDNIFVYKNKNEIIKILKNGTGVVYLGFPECAWCQAYVKILNEAAKNAQIDKIYYFNILEDRKNNTEEYKTIINILKNHLLYDDEGNHRIYVPDVTIVKNGKIIGHDNESSIITDENLTPESYWTNERIKNLKEKLTTYFNEINKRTCTSC